MRPAYIFAGNIILVTFECIGKFNVFFGKGDNSLDTHLGRPILFVRWPKSLNFTYAFKCYQQSWPRFSWATLYISAHADWSRASDGAHV